MKRIICIIATVMMALSLMAGCNNNAQQIRDNNRIIAESKKKIDAINKVQEQSNKVQDLIDAYQNK